MDDDEGYLDRVRGRMAESDFWFNEYSIPQYELLVREGLLSQAEADDYREQREQMGLPMTFAELKAAPHEAFRWVRAAGGPVLGPHDEFEGAGMRWRAWYLAERGTVQADEGQPQSPADGFLRREVSQSHNGQGVQWSVSYRTPNDGPFLLRGGQVSTFAEALAAAAGVAFPMRAFAGHPWYAKGSEGSETESWCTKIDEATIEVSRYAHGDDSRAWRWERGCPETSPEFAIASCFDAWKFSGWATTRDDAIAAAIAAPVRLRTLAGALLGDDRFEAGRRAGVAAAQAHLQGLR